MRSTTWGRWAPSRRPTGRSASGRARASGVARVALPAASADDRSSLIPDRRTRYAYADAHARAGAGTRTPRRVRGIARAARRAARDPARRAVAAAGRAAAGLPVGAAPGA